MGKRGERWQKGAEIAVACILHSRVSCNTAVYIQLKDIFGSLIDSSSLTLGHRLVQIGAMYIMPINDGLSTWRVVATCVNKLCTHQ